MKLMNRFRAAALLTLMAFGCAEHTTRPEAGVEPPATEPPARPFGVLEITLTEITRPAEMSASARNVDLRETTGTASGGAESSTVLSLDPVEEGAKSGIQLEPLTTLSFTHGQRGAGGQRYVSATFRARNASADGFAYTTPLDNLTFLAVDTDGTIGQTPVSKLLRFDGSDSPASLASGVRPTGSASLDASGEVTAVFADVLQAFTESEAAAVAAPAGVADVFPYGFVVRNPDEAISRTLPATPTADQFDGVVTFAFRLPLAADPADDPYEISVMALAVSDSETRITQSFEEQTVCADDLEARAEALGATTVTLLEGGGLNGALPTREIAQVRTAGSAASPAAVLPDAVTDAYVPTFVLALPDSGVTPIAWSVQSTADPDDDPDRVIAVFGYYQPDTVATTIPKPSRNMFFPSPSDRLQPTTFFPGLHVPPDSLVFTLEFNIAATPELVWQLIDGEVRTAEANAGTEPPCL